MKPLLSTEPNAEIGESPDNVSTLFSDLIDNPDIDTHHCAGELLVKLGPKVLPQLNLLLGSSNKIIRMEAIKIISLIGHRSSIQPLIASLEDPERDVSLIAAEGLIHIGRPCMTPLLRRLSERPASNHLKLTAHRILTALINLKDPKNLRHLVLLLKHVSDEIVTNPFAPTEITLKFA